jgi:hypothetical protein
MSTRTNIEAKAWDDIRFAVLARLLGLADRDFALVKCARIWSWQAEYYTPERPTYVVSPDIVDAILGPDGHAHLVRAQLGEAVPEGIRMRGSVGRIEWYWKTCEAGRRGSEAAAAARRDDDGAATPAVGNHAHKDVPRGSRAGSPAPTPLTLPPVLPPGSQRPENLEPVRESEAPPRARARAIPPTRSAKGHGAEMPEGWTPADSPKNFKAARTARANRVVVEHELAKFVDWAEATRAVFADWDARWRMWLRDARPTEDHVREAAARAGPRKPTLALVPDLGGEPAAEERAAAIAAALRGEPTILPNTKPPTKNTRPTP